MNHPGKRRSAARPNEEGFTLVFTILLVLIVTALAGTVITRVVTSNRATVRDGLNQVDSDLALVGVNLAYDEVGQKTDMMSNVVWSSDQITDASWYASGAVPPRNSPMAAIREVVTGEAVPATESVTFNSRSYRLSGYPLRELGLLGNIRYWPAFADWSKWETGATPTNQAQWSRGWEYLPPGTNPLYYESYGSGAGTSTTLAAGSPIKVDQTITTRSYWYAQISPQPPEDGSAAPEAWPNKTTEYSKGLFYQPVLWKVYKLGKDQAGNDLRAAAFVRMSLQEYFGGSGAPNRLIDGKTVFSPVVDGFNGANLIGSADARQAITFSIFCVAEGRPLTFGTSGAVTSRGMAKRYHQALNVAVGPCEYNSGNAGIYSIPTGWTAPNNHQKALPLVSTDTGNLTYHDGSASFTVVNGTAASKFLDRTSRYQTVAGTTIPYELNVQTVDASEHENFRSAYFAPSFDTPGNGALVMHQPISGKVYPASLDLRHNNGYAYPMNPRNNHQVAFLYETIEFPGRKNVIFFIEQIPGQAGKFRRRLLRDEVSTPDSRYLDGNILEPLRIGNASYSTTVGNPWDPGAMTTVNERYFPSLLYWANKPFIRRENGGTVYGDINHNSGLTSGGYDPKWHRTVRLDPIAAAVPGFQFGKSDFTRNPIEFTSQNGTLYSVCKYPSATVDDAAKIDLEDHWATDSFNPDNIGTLPGSYTDMVYPFTVKLDKGSFTIGADGVTGTALPGGNAVNWPNNPLLARGISDETAQTSCLPAEMPWQGPTRAIKLAVTANQATVSYSVTTYPQWSYSAYWGGVKFRGGGRSFETQVATQSVNGR